MIISKEDNDQRPAVITWRGWPWRQGCGCRSDNEGPPFHTTDPGKRHERSEGDQHGGPWPCAGAGQPYPLAFQRVLPEPRRARRTSRWPRTAPRSAFASAECASADPPTSSASCRSPARFVRS